jgi:hypothetical protein
VNLIEGFFSILTRQGLQQAVHQSAKELEHFLKAFVELWNAWHHHMALVMMAMLFMLSEKLRMQEQCPLTCADIERLLAAFLPRRDASPEQVLSHMNRRHEMRRRAIESHAKRNAERRFKIT